jgi:hypothetical protein
MDKVAAIKRNKLQGKTLRIHALSHELRHLQSCVPSRCFFGYKVGCTNISLMNWKVPGITKQTY